MSGAVLTLLGGATAGGGGGGGGVTETWTNIYGAAIGATNTITFSGLSGALSISAAITGTGELGRAKNHTAFGYNGAFTVSNGDTLYWYVVSPGGACSGTITITDATHSTTMATFTYVLTG